MILINIFLVLLIFLIISDLYIKNSPKSKLNLVPINYRIKKKDGLNELIVDLKIINKSKTKETMVSDINFELDFFKLIFVFIFFFRNDTVVFVKTFYRKFRIFYINSF